MNEFPDNETLMIWLVNLLAERFPAQAVLKGGMELRLFNCPRHTNDLDYVFVPFSSKKDVVRPVLAALARFPELAVTHAMHSTCLRITVAGGKARVQIEISAARDCPSQPLSTADIARRHNQQGRVVRVMALDLALAHKLAAWLERGLLRDLYDVYFMHEILGVQPDRETLQARLADIRYRDSRSCGSRTIDMPRFAETLRGKAVSLTAADIDRELQGILAPEELPGLDLKLRKAMLSIAGILSPA